MKDECKFEGCRKLVVTKGYCATHYMRFLKYGDASVVHKRGRCKKEKPKCSVDNCSKPVLAYGLCRSHYDRRRRNVNKPLSDPILCRVPKKGTCIVPHCGNDRKTNGLCNHHLHLLNTTGSLKEKVKVYSTHETLSAQGYIRVGSTNKYKHRLVMAEHLGRALSADERIVFKDGNKLNCNIDNLLLIKGQSEAHRLAMKLNKERKHGAP